MSGTGPRYARRVDTNHKEIRQAFRANDCAVLDTSNLGGKMGDLLVQPRRYDGMYPATYMIEIKRSAKAKLTVSQETNPLQLIRIETLQDVRDFVEVIRAEA